MAQEIVEKEFVPRTPWTSRNLGEIGRAHMKDVLELAMKENIEQPLIPLLQNTLHGAVNIYVEKIAFTPPTDQQFNDLELKLKDLAVADAYIYDEEERKLHHDEFVRAMEIIRQLLEEEDVREDMGKGLRKKDLAENREISSKAIGELLQSWEQAIFEGK